METYRIAGHVDMFEDGGRMNIEGCSKLTTVSIELTAAALRSFSHIVVRS